MNISTFTYKDISIDITYNKGYLAYSFFYEDAPYGYKIKLEKKKIIDVASATALLVLNIIETYEALHATGTSDGTKTT